MTNEEKEKQIVSFVLNPKCANESNGLGFLNNHNLRIADLNNINKCCEVVAMQAMQWKDEQFTKEKQQWIDKACEWLKQETNNYATIDDYGIQYGKGARGYVRIDMLLNGFKKAMEGEL